LTAQSRSFFETIADLIRKNFVILKNAFSIISTFGVSSALGLVFWKVAASYFSPAEVGIAAAAISAMMLMGNFSMFGLGSLLVGEVQRTPERATALISSALLVSGAIAAVLGAVFAIFSPNLSPDFMEFAANPLVIAIFALGVMLTTVLQVLDLAFVGFLHSDLQLSRNTVFALAKLLLVPVAAFVALATGGIKLYFIWALGHIISILVLPLMARGKSLSLSNYRPKFAYLFELWKLALAHHILNIALQVTALAMPIIVTSLFSAEANAGFSIAAQLALFLHNVPVSITYALYAVSAGDSSLLAEKSRFTLRLSFALISLGALVAILLAPFVMGFFGESYAATGTFALQGIALAALPVIIRAHFVAINQIHRTMRRAAIVMAFAAAMELGLALFGGINYGLNGLVIAWVIALFIQALICLPLVIKTAQGK
jgi:O-antigen/teichoic acid export membrane protein